MRKVFVYATLQKEFIHQYDSAPGEVWFLKYPHRHIAHIKVSIQVFDDDREIEFIMLKRWLDNSLDFEDVTGVSCESIADDILVLVQSKYGASREVKVEVSEDAENGCELIYKPVDTEE